MALPQPAPRPLRIAYLLESAELSGGVKVVGLQAGALARRGHHVAIVCPEAGVIFLISSGSTSTYCPFSYS